VNNESCHGVWECLQLGSSRRRLRPLAKPRQKLRSYLVWHIENLGWLRGLQAAGLGLWHKVSQPPRASGRSAPAAAGECLGLQPGELVEVRPIDEILATLDPNRRHKGLLWMNGMNKHCGRRYRVYQRLERILLETNGELRNMKNTVLLEDVMCDGKAFGGCNRSCFHFWREVWLKRIPS